MSVGQKDYEKKIKTRVIVTVVGSAESVPASAEPRQSHNTTFFIFIHLLQELQFFV